MSPLSRNIPSQTKQHRQNISDTRVAAVDSPIENEQKRRAWLEKRRRRQQAITEAMRLMTEKTEEERDREKLQELLQEAEVSEEELRRISIRNQAIHDHVWTEAPAVYDSMIGEQDLDHEWTGTIEDALGGLLKNHSDLKSQVVDVKCYETLCRGVFDHETEDDMKRFRDAAEESAIKGPSQGFIKRNEDGSVKTTVYFTRIGDDALLLEEMYDRLYEKVTGESVALINQK
jgi:hypothetical protein